MYLAHQQIQATKPLTDSNSNVTGKKVQSTKTHPKTANQKPLSSSCQAHDLLYWKMRISLS